MRVLLSRRVLFALHLSAALALLPVSHCHLVPLPFHLPWSSVIHGQMAPTFFARFVRCVRGFPPAPFPNNNLLFKCTNKNASANICLRVLRAALADCNLIPLITPAVTSAPRQSNSRDAKVQRCNMTARHLRRPPYDTAESGRRHFNCVHV